ISRPRSCGSACPTSRCGRWAAVCTFDLSPIQGNRDKTLNNNAIANVSHETSCLDCEVCVDDRALVQTEGRADRSAGRGSAVADDPGRKGRAAGLDWSQGDFG